MSLSEFVAPALAARERRFRESMADATKQFISESEFAKDCLATLRLNPALAASDIDAIEEATRRRLEEIQDAVGAGSEVDMPDYGRSPSP